MGLSFGPQKKRDNKAGDKEQKKQDKMERQSQLSGISYSSNKSFGNALKGIPGTVF
jgi:hypothetical protein